MIAEEKILEAFKSYEQGNGFDKIFKFPFGFYQYELKKIFLPEHGKWVKKSIVNFTQELVIVYIRFIQFLYKYCQYLKSIKNPKTQINQFARFIENQYQKSQYQKSLGKRIYCPKEKVKDVFDILIGLRDKIHVRDSDIVYVLDTCFETGLKASTLKTMLSEYKKIL